MLRTREKYDVFNTLGEIYLVYLPQKVYILNTLSLPGKCNNLYTTHIEETIFNILLKEAVDVSNRAFCGVKCYCLLVSQNACVKNVSRRP